MAGMLVRMMAEPSSAMDQVAMFGTSPVCSVSDAVLGMRGGLARRTGWVRGLVQAVEEWKAYDTRDERAEVMFVRSGRGWGTGGSTYKTPTEQTMSSSIFFRRDRFSPLKTNQGKDRMTKSVTMFRAAST